MRARSPIEMMVDKACGFDPNAPPPPREPVKADDEQTQLVCAMLHKPRFYAPIYLMRDTWGWKRKCEDFAQKDEAQK